MSNAVALCVCACVYDGFVRFYVKVISTLEAIEWVTSWYVNWFNWLL